MDFINKMVDKTALERLRHVADTPFKRISYTEAVEILEGVVRDKKKKFEFPVPPSSTPMPLRLGPWAQLPLCWLNETRDPLTNALCEP